MINAVSVEFQSTRPRGARQNLKIISRLKGMIDFNPRARVGRDSTNADRNAYNKISIHAPAWGAT